MTIYEIWLKGGFTQAIEKKALKTSIVLHCEIYQSFKKTRAAGFKYKESIDITAETMCVSTFTVRRAIRVVSK